MTSSFSQVLGQISPAFIVIGLGYLYNFFFKQEIQTLTRISMGLLVPAFAFVHLYQMEINMDLISTVFLSAWIIILAPGLLAVVLFRHWNIQHPGLYLPVMFMNSVNLPFPIILSAYGDQAFPFAVMFYLASILGVFTLGVLIASGGQGSFHLFKEPVIYVIALALWMKSQDIDIPPLLVEPVALLESATVPLVLLTLGMQLALVKPSQLKLPLLATGLRMGGGLLAALLCVTIFPIEGLARKVVLLISIMPSAVISSMVAGKYNADPELVSSTIFISTLLALIVIPAALWAIG